MSQRDWARGRKTSREGLNPQQGRDGEREHASRLSRTPRVVSGAPLETEVHLLGSLTAWA